MDKTSAMSDTVSSNGFSASSSSTRKQRSVEAIAPDLAFSVFLLFAGRIINISTFAKIVRQENTREHANGIIFFPCFLSGQNYQFFARAATVICNAIGVHHLFVVLNCQFGFEQVAALLRAG
jgi:hypothetical protein